MGLMDADEALTHPQLHLMTRDEDAYEASYGIDGC